MLNLPELDQPPVRAASSNDPLFSNSMEISPSCALMTPAASVTSLLRHQGVNVMHGVNPALVGRDLYDFKDPNGVLMTSN